jgi:hypothetical protein
MGDGGGFGGCGNPSGNPRKPRNNPGKPEWNPRNGGNPSGRALFSITSRVRFAIFYFFVDLGACGGVVGGAGGGIGVEMAHA